MKTLEEVLTVGECGLCREEIEEAVREEWVKPTQSGQEVLFEEIDITRLQLIGELRGRLEVNREAVPLVLSLLDQLYGTRRRLQRLVEAVEHQPRHVQAEIFALLTER